MYTVDYIVQKYGFDHSRGNTRKLHFTANTDDFVFNAVYISVAVISKTFTIQSRYNIASLFLYYIHNTTLSLLISDDKNILLLIIMVTNIIIHMHLCINKSAHDIISLLIHFIIIRN